MRAVKESAVKRTGFWPRLLSLATGLSMTLAACGPASTEVVSPLSPTRQETDAPAESQEIELTPEQAALVEKAKEDLSERLNMPVNDITLQAVESIQWRDSSLGCPQPGMQYLMVITPGYLIRMEAKGRSYEYHASKRNVVYCEP